MRAARHTVAMSGALLGLALGYGPCPAAMAEDSWSPFKSNAERPGERRPRPSEAATPVPPAPVHERAPDPAGPPSAPWASPRGGAVERSELAPVMAPDASGLPLELWRGLDLKTLEELLAGLELPPRSPALHQLWRRMLLSSATPPAGASKLRSLPGAASGGALPLRAARRHGEGAERERRARPRRADAARPHGHRARPARGRLPGDRDAGGAELRAARPPEGRDAAAGRLLRGGRRRCASRRSRRRSRTRGRHRGRAAAGGAGRASPPAPSRSWRCPHASCCSTTASWSCWARSTPPRSSTRPSRRCSPRWPPTPKHRCAAADRRGRGGAAAQCAVAGGHGGRSIAGSRCSVAAPPIRSAQSADPLLRRALYFQAVEAARTPAQRRASLRAIDRRCPPVRRAICRRRACWPRWSADLQPSPDVAAFAETGLEIALARRPVRAGAPLGRERRPARIGWR